jgi:hypothetical protein
MFYFKTKNPNLVKFWSAFDLKKLIYFMDIWNTLETFGKLYDHLIYFVFIWYLFPVLHQDKSGNPDTSWKQKKMFERQGGGCERVFEFNTSLFLRI